MRTIYKDAKSPFEIIAKYDREPMILISNIRVVIPVHDSLQDKPEYKQFNMMKLLYAIKRGSLKVIQTDSKQ